MLDDFTVFVNNKYYRWYKKLVERRDDDPFRGPGEDHHYIPKSIKKNTDLVSLSYREHYIAHLLLSKCVVPEYRSKMLYAVTAMKLSLMRKIKFNSHLFESLKIKANVSRSIAHTGKIVSAETRLKLREANLGKKYSAESRAKQSAKKKGVKHTPEHTAKIVAFHTGRKRSAETIEKLSKHNSNRTPITCPHCGKSAASGTYHRWHGDKCRSLLVVSPDRELLHHSVELFPRP